MKFVWIGLAGAAGALARYALQLLAVGLAPTLTAFPWGTLFINVIGSFLLGLVTGLGADRGVIPPVWREPIAVGFIGAFTTFSAWAVDTVSLLDQGAWQLAAANGLTSLVLGLAAVSWGLRLGGWTPGAARAQKAERARELG